jgi:hypothetical protein
LCIIGFPCLGDTTPFNGATELTSAHGLKGRLLRFDLDQLRGARIMRYGLTDGEWTAIEPMLPNKPRGVPRVNDRRVLNGIFWVLRSGAPWRAICRTTSVLIRPATIGCALETS